MSIKSRSKLYGCIMNIDINKLVEIDISNVKYNGAYELFHYTGIENIDKILLQDNQVFRMTYIDDFSDKMEGKLITGFYNQAVEKLYQNGVIDQRIRKFLLPIINRINNREHYFLVSDPRFDCNVMKKFNYNDYVLCFTTDGASDYMTDNYIKNDTHTGCVIRVCGNFVDRLLPMYKNCSIRKVLYGEEVIEFLYKRIKSILNCGDNTNEFLVNFADPLIWRLIKTLISSSKDSKFRNEREVRLIKSIPEGDNQIQTINGKHYIYIEIPRCRCWGVRLIGDFNTDEGRRCHNLLNERGYRVT